MGLKLELDLVPQTCWFSNLRSELSSKDWNALRRTQRARDRYRCQGCGCYRAKGLHCHERWTYLEMNGRRVQRLAGLMTLCRWCHEVKHMGFAELQGRGGDALVHFAEVNELTPEEAHRQVEEAFRVWRDRSRHDWELDISWLKGRVEEGPEKIEEAARNRQELIDRSREEVGDRLLAAMQEQFGPTPSGEMRIAMVFGCAHTVGVQLPDPDTLTPEEAASLMLGLSMAGEGACPECSGFDKTDRMVKLTGCKEPPSKPQITQVDPCSVVIVPGPSSGPMMGAMDPAKPVVKKRLKPKAKKGPQKPDEDKTIIDDEGREYEWC